MRFLPIQILIAFLSSPLLCASPAAASAETWERYEDNPILIPGFEAGFVLNDPSVLFDEEEQRWKMWVAVGRFVAEGEVRVDIRYFDSDDGTHWNFHTDFALESNENSDSWDHTHAETPTVVKNPSGPPERRYLLWYSGGNMKKESLQGFPIYKIGLAFSRDGKKFTRLPAAASPYGEAGLLIKARDAFPNFTNLAAGVVSDPEVVLKNGVFYLWFSGFALDASNQLIASGTSFATCSNGLKWKMSNKNPLPSLSRKESPAGPSQPTVVWNALKGIFEMWFTDHTPAEEKTLGDPNHTLGFWYAASKNGEDWVPEYGKERDFVENRSFPSESQGVTTGADMALKDGEYFLYYGAWGSRKVPEGWFDNFIWAIHLAKGK